jgi:predicted small metal-binding protein
MALVVTCPCGVTIRAETEDEFVRLVQQHAKTVHNQTVTRQEALAPARRE